MMRIRRETFHPVSEWMISMSSITLSGSIFTGRYTEGKIPESVRAKECTAHGESIFKYDPKCKVALAYEELTKEVLAHDC